MRKTILIAALLILSLTLVGCDTLMDKVKDVMPAKDADLDDKVTDSVIEEKDGAMVTVISADATSLTVKIENNTESAWQSGNMRDYSIEAYKDGEWYKVKQLGEFANTMELMIFTPGQTMTHTFEFSERYGKLSAGEYRLVKSFWANATATEDAHEFTLVCEFTVE